jgi:peptidyl-tRNA hydrolase, PTH1 family
MMGAVRCILGIGNPGAKYAHTRHNCGFAVIDELARRHDLSRWQSKWNAEVCEWQVPDALGGGKALLIKPSTFVNLSGEVAQALLAFYKIPPSDLLVVVDDINLPLGDLRLRAKGSAGGHNGLRDIEMRIGQEYPRLRMGVGKPPTSEVQIDHVLSPFAPEERADADAMVRKAAECVESWLGSGVEVSCRYNGPLRPRPRPPAPEAPENKNPEQGS